MGILNKRNDCISCKFLYGDVPKVLAQRYWRIVFRNKQTILTDEGF